MSLRVPSFRAYAKINLGLFVLEKRPDGYHNIDTVFHRIDLYDEINFSPSSEISVESSSQEAPSDERNICFKAAALLRKHLGIKLGVRIAINKHIPVGAGLGGGSSDAAIVLLRLPAFWGTTLDAVTLQMLALQLGSDVPFFLKTGSAYATGRGEILNYFTLDMPYSILLCNPGIHVSTAWAYHRVKPQRRSIDIKDIVEKGIKTASHLTTLANDFEQPVFDEYPMIKNVKDTMVHAGALFASMSGSGSSVFGLFDSNERVREATLPLGKAQYGTYLTNPHFAPVDQ